MSTALRTRDTRPAALRRLAEHAAGQHGYVTRAQAVEAGVHDVMLRRLVEADLLEDADHGVYRSPLAQRLPWAPVWVAWLRLDPAGDPFERARQPTEVVRGPTAAFVHQIGNLVPEPYEFWTARQRQSRRHDVRFRTGRLPRQDVMRVQGLPVTTPARTLADLVADHHDLEHVADALADALDRRLIDDEELRQALERTLPARRRARAGELVSQLMEDARS